MILNIYIPDDNVNERIYIVDVVLKELLGIDTCIDINVNSNLSGKYLLRFNDKKLIIKDYFFSYHKMPLSYLKKKNIPSNIRFADIKISSKIFLNVPILYGNEDIRIERDKIVCNLDVFASCFFFLTRWEEYVNDKRDKFGRFPGSESLAFKFGFLHRPIVNEYIEILWSLIKVLFPNIRRKKRYYSLVMTHDVDRLIKFQSVIQLIRNVIGDIYISKDFTFLNTLNDYIFYKLGKKDDPFCTFDLLMDLAEIYGFKAFFFFISGAKTKYDNNYAFRNRDLLEKILYKIDQRGHFIGIHPSFSTYNDIKKWEKEYEYLSEISPQPIKYGRQHYLRFEVPTTWRIWDYFGMEWDSSMYYGELGGFRCGTCYTFSVFDIINRKKLNLKEKPLIFMEGTYVRFGEKRFLKELRRYVDKVKRYKGEMVFLMHNNFQRFREVNLSYIINDIYKILLS